MRLLFSLCLLFGLKSISTSFAQQIPQLSPFKENQFVWNPALLNSKYSSVILNHRRDWSQFENSPEFSNLSIAHQFDRQPISLGANVGKESVGPFSNIFLQGTYCYNLKFANQNSLALGASVRHLNRKMFGEKLVFPSPDLALSTSYTSESTFVFGAQYELDKDSTNYSLKFGASYHHSINNNIARILPGEGTLNIPSDNYLTSNVGYNFEIGKADYISVEAFYIHTLPKSNDPIRYYTINLAYYRDNLYFGGLMYNSNGLISIYTGLHWKRFSLAVNANYWVNTLNQNGGTGYDVMLGYILKSKTK